MRVFEGVSTKRRTPSAGGQAAAAIKGAEAGIADAFGTPFQRKTAAAMLDDNVEPVEDEH
jgi:hypothetical protein